MSPEIEGLLSILGALGLFLYAISRFGDGMQKMAGDRIRVLLETQARGPLPSIFTGIGIGAALQNNFLTSGMVSSLVNASLLDLLPALYILLGVNLGLTITPQLISLNLGAISFLLLFIGYLLYFYSKKRNWHHLGQVIFNLALMYLSFAIFHQSFELLASNLSMATMIQGILINPWTGFLFGLVLAIIFRNSNTIVILIQGMVGIELALSSSMFLKGAFAIILGANVGTTIISLLVGLDRFPTARKANWMQFSFNLSTALLWLAFLPFVFSNVNTFCQHLSNSFEWFETSVFRFPLSPNLDTTRWFNVWELAMIHSLFNLSVICLWFPITIAASKLGMPFFIEKGRIGSNGTNYLDRRALQSPALALVLATHEINQMATITQEMLKSARLAFMKGQVHLINSIQRDEQIVDDLQEQITFYLSALLSQNSLTEVQSHRLAGLLHIVSDIERVGDHANNIANLADKRYQEHLPFSELAINEMELFFGKAIDVYNKACQILKDSNLEIAKQIESREENIDKLEEELRQNHIHRLNQGKCWPGSGVVYVEILSNLQRISAHSANIAVAILEEGEE